MKIDFYISSLSSGGAEHVLTTLATNFAHRSHEVSITSFEKRPQFYQVDANVDVFKFDFTKKNRLAELTHDFWAFKKQIRNRKADVAISFLSRCNIMLILAGVFSRTKIIVCDRNNLLEKYSKVVFSISCMLYSLADMVCVQTHEIKKMYPRYLQKKIFVLENPLDFEAMAMQCEGKALEKENVIISVGRLEPQKDFKTLIRAFKMVSDEFPEWKLNIFGQGNMREELQQMIDNFGMSKRIQLCGVTKTPFLEMKRSKIFVLSSFYEGFPNVLCEAMHAALPCISTECKCGPAELICDGENGILVPVGDANMMAEKLKYLMNHEDVQRQMGDAAEKSVKRLENSVICDEWMAMVEKVAK